MKLLLACLTLVALTGCLSITPERIRLSNSDFGVQSTHLDAASVLGSP